MIYLILLILCCVSALLGRAGGSGNWPRYFRVNLIPLLLTAIAFQILGINNAYALFGFCLLTTITVSTYWDEVFGYDNFWSHGFFIGLSSLPLTLITHNYNALILRAVLLAIWMGVTHIYVTKAHVEEKVRYFILPISMLFI